MAQRKIYTGLVFLKPDRIADHIKKLETREHELIIEQPKIATEETLLANNLTPERVRDLLGDSMSEGWNAYEYKYREATKKEWNECVRKHGGVFQTI